ncbi:MAG: hypothetical protein CM15mP89_0790 [Gammaproteobacteria bacterium]|nr:MAG: hypothetical protein CM15mP89_0790 [Gammaproteobacteria bacterium]
MTNNHVIAGADAIQVLLADGRSASASVVGSDPETDLAILHIDLPALTPIALADAEDIAVGDVVLAIGNPYGFGHSVSRASSREWAASVCSCRPTRAISRPMPPSIWVALAVP